MPFSDTELALLPCWEALVDLEPTRRHGTTPWGGRSVVPIIGGQFDGVIAPELDRPIPFRGRVIPGGFDLQRQRADGIEELQAIYHMETDDGVVIEIRNEVVLELTEAGEIHYGRSRIHVEAPVGKYDWLNKRLFVGTVEVTKPEAQVKIRSWVLV